MGRISRAATLAALVALAACGGDDSGGSSSTTAAPASTAAPATTGTPATTAAPVTTPVTTAAPTSSATTTTVVTTVLPLVVDTDLASDDLIALAYLISDNRVDLLAVTVTGTGEVTCPRGAVIARSLLDRLGAVDVPVACGRSTPLEGDRVFPAEWRAAADAAYDLPLSTALTPDPGPDAVTLLTDVVVASPTPVTLLTLGPLTNVAEAIAARPDLVERLAGIVMMGGAVNVPGNVQLDPALDPLPVEWNLYIDPAADAAVIGSGALVTLVTLDATNAVPVDADVVAELAANDRTDAAGVVSYLLSRWAPPYLWDTLAAIAAAHPELVPSDDTEIRVITEGDEAGRTAAQAGGTPVKVALPPDVDVVMEHLIRTLGGFRPDEPLVVPTTIAPVGRATVNFDGAVCTYDGPTAVPTGPVVFTRELGAVDFLVSVVHLRPGATVEETMAWAAEHGSDLPPMVDDFTVIGDIPGAVSSPAAITLAPGTNSVVCISRDEVVYLGGVITVS